jgi:hypothetical protein
MDPIDSSWGAIEKLWSSIRQMSRMFALTAAIGWSTTALCEPPVGYPPGKSAWQITFERGKAENPIQAFWLDACAAVLKAEPRVNIDIISYGDLGESVDANAELAQKRGEWALARVRNAGVDPRRLKIVNKGSDEAGREYYQVEIFYR